MGAPKGNRFWKNRLDMTKDGRKLSVEQVVEKLNEYIERCVDDRLYSKDWIGKDATEIERPHMISMSIYGASVHLGINSNTWREWRKDEKYSSVLTRAEDIFKAYNVEGSAAGLLNQSIIARIEGLKEKIDQSSEDGSMTPKPTIVVKDQKTAENIAKLMNKNADN